MSKETGIFIGIENTDKEVILQEYKSQSTKSLEPGKIGEGNKIVIIDPEDKYKNLAKILEGEIINIDLSKSKCGWINPFTGESSRTEKLKEKAKKAIKSRKYKKAYRLLKKVKKLTKAYYEERE